MSEGVVSPELEGLMLLISAVRPVDREDIRFYLHFLLVDEWTPSASIGAYSHPTTD